MDKPNCILSGVPVGAPGYKPGDDYRAVSCDICGNDFWLGPMQQAAKREFPDLPVMCLYCAKILMPDFRVERMADE